MSDYPESTTWNGEDRRPWPSSHGQKPNAMERLDFQNRWLALHGQIRGQRTMAQILEEERAWKERPPQRRQPSIDRTKYCWQCGDDLADGQCPRCERKGVSK